MGEHQFQRPVDDRRDRLQQGSLGQLAPHGGALRQGPLGQLGEHRRVEIALQQGLAQHLFVAGG